MTDPTGIDEPCVRLVSGHFVRQHLSVMCWVQNDERLTETRAESGDWFPTRNLGSVTTDKMIHDLIIVELRDERQNTSGIASQHDDVFGVVRDARDLGVWDILNWIRAPSVFCETCVVVIDDAVNGVEDDIFKHCAEMNSVEDFRCGFFREPNTLN